MEKVQIAISLRQSGQTVKEIAAILNVHPRTVRKWFAANPALMVDKTELGEVPTNLPDIIESMQQSCALEAAAIKVRIEGGNYGNSSVLWRITKSLQILAVLKAAQPEETSDGWDSADEERIRDEIHKKLKRIVKVNREKTSNSPGQKLTKTAATKKQIWKGPPHKWFGPWPEWIKSDEDVSKWIAEMSALKNATKQPPPD